MGAMSGRREGRRREENEVEFSRIVAFSDGVFAIAITLLVLNLGIGAGLQGDEIWQAIWDQREDFIAYAISFAVIGKFWLVHHQFFGEVRAFDGRLIALNLLYLASIVLIPFSSQVLGEYGDQTAAVVVYAVNLAACCLVGFWMSAFAHNAGFTTIDETAAREDRIRTIYITIVFLLAIPPALVAPSLAPLFWLALFFDPAPRIAARSRPSA
jgi:TMEM175 potassium channel family protein